MSLKMKKVVVSWFFSLFLVFAAITGAQAYDYVLAFGDSLSDNGVADGYGNGRYSNGKVWVEYIANDLNVSLYDMAYGGAVSGQNDPYAWKSVYTSTYNYYINTLGESASTADYYATLNANNSGYDSKFGLQWQVDTYVANVMGSRDISNSLITMTAGGNDFFNYYANAILGTPYSPQSAVDYANGLYAPNVAAANIANAVAKLIAAGGQEFLIQNLAMPGNDWAAAFNAYLAVYLANLGLANPDANIMILDMTKFVADAENYTDAWLYNSCDSPYSDPATCTDETYAWYDQVGVHPTTLIHEQIAEYAKDTYDPQPTQTPEPASILMLILGFAGLVGLRRRMK